MPDDSIYEKKEINSIVIYFRFCIELHMAINQTEKANGYPGCRSVLAFGDCIEYLAEGIKFDDYVLNYAKPKGQSISAFIQENGNLTVIYDPNELQMNTAFSKAYILEGGKFDNNSVKNIFYIDQTAVNAVIDYGKRRGFSHVWQEMDKELRLLIPYDKEYLNEMVIGFAFDKSVFTSNVKGYSTKVYKLMKLFPYDEPVDEFCFDLREGFRKI